MHKNEFLKTLEVQLKGIRAEDRQEILYDYAEHFRNGLEEGKTEEEIADALGNPKTLAKQFKASFMVEQAKDTASTGNVFRAVVAVISLGFFNLVFVLGPFLGILGVLLGLFAASAAVIISGVAVFFGVIAHPILGAYLHIPSYLLDNIIGSIALGTGLIALGLLMSIGVCFLARFLYLGTVKYLQMNIRIISGRRK